jgi:hypothetical protein
MNPKIDALVDILKSAYRRIDPADLDVVSKNVSDKVRRMIEMADETGGFSFNPRTGEFLKAKEDFGYMMSTVPEMADINRIPLTDPNIEQRIADLMSNPYYRDRLTRGQYLGGWIDDGKLVIDPSQRFVNKNRSILMGNDVGRQMAGFDVARDVAYGLTPDVVAEARRVAEDRAAKQALAVLLGLPGAGAGIGMAINAGTD